MYCGNMMHDDFNSYDSKKVWQHAFRKMHKALEKEKYEWWPCEGTLIGPLRFGSNFGKLSDHDELCVDVDIDLMVRVKDKNEYEKLCKYLTYEFRKHWIPSYADIGTDLQMFKLNLRNKKYLCSDVFKTFGQSYYDIHFDIHPYMVDTKKNITYCSKKCIESNKTCNGFPFQYWGGTVPYNGFIRTPDGNFLKGRMDDLDISIPYKYMEILGHWNNGEYKKETLYRPVLNSCMFSTKTNIWEINNFTPTFNTDHADGGWNGSLILSEQNKKELHNYRKNLRKNNYATFPEPDKE
jgi:hypothetical protein